MYNYNHLYYFYITAKTGSVTGAAAHLCISQPSLTSQIKVLESRLDVKLFQKVGRTNQLTENGQIIFGYCRRMFELSEEMGEVLLKGLPTSTRRIHIGVSDEVERSFVVEIVSHFLKKQEPIRRPKVSIVSGTQNQLAERLKFREIDVVVTEAAMMDPSLMNMAWAESPVVLTCSKNWKPTGRVSKTKEIDQSAKSLFGSSFSQWVMPSNQFKLRSEIDHFFEKNEIKGRTVLESDVLASLVRSVEDEVGLAFLPLLYVKRELKEKSIRILGPKKGYWLYKIWLVCSPGSIDDSLISSFSESFTEIAGLNRSRK